MKRSHLTVISLLIICAAALLYIMSGRSGQQQRQRRLHDYVDPATLQSVTVAQAGQQVELVPRESAWYMQDGELLVEVDAGAMLKMIEFINNAMIIRKVTGKTETWPRFELDDKGALTLTLQAAGESSTVYIGKKKDHATQFVRLPDDPAVYLVSQTLDAGPEPWRWQYRRVLRYAPDMLGEIDYDCGEKILHLQRDAASGDFTVQDVPAGKTSADLRQLVDAFHDIGIAQYVPRERTPASGAVATHTLYFTDGSSARLRFLDRDEENDTPPHLVIVFEGAEPTDKQLRYARDVCARYVFSLSWIDASKYRKVCDEFFTDPPPAPETTGAGPDVHGG